MNIIYWPVIGWKRFVQNKLLVCLFLLFPLIYLLESNLEAGGSDGGAKNFTAAVTIQGNEQEDMLLQKILEEKDGRLRYAICRDTEEAEKMVGAKRADIGFTITADVWRNIEEKSGETSVYIYYVSDMNGAEVFRECLFSDIYTVASLSYFGERLAQEKKLDADINDLRTMLLEKMGKDELFALHYNEVEEKSEEKQEKSKLPVLFAYLTSLLLYYCGIQYGKWKSSTVLCLVHARNVIFLMDMLLALVWSMVWLLMAGMPLFGAQAVFILLMAVLSLLFGCIVKEKVGMKIFPIFALGELVVVPVLFNIGETIQLVNIVGKGFPLWWFLYYS